MTFKPPYIASKDFSTMDTLAKTLSCVSRVVLTEKGVSMPKAVKYISWELFCDKCNEEAFDGDFRSYTKAKFIKRCKKEGWLIKDEKILCPKCK